MALPHAARKDVFDALFTLLKTIPAPTGMAWKLTSQRLRHWDDVSAAEQPAMFLERAPQTAEQKHAFGVTGWHWRVLVWIYYRVDGYKTESTYPDLLTDQFLDKIEETFQTDPNNGPVTLGGLVNHCWIDGTIVWESGTNDGQAVLVIPLSILL